MAGFLRIVQRKTPRQWSLGVYKQCFILVTGFCATTSTPLPLSGKETGKSIVGEDDVHNDAKDATILFFWQGLFCNGRNGKTKVWRACVRLSGGSFVSHGVPKRAEEPFEGKSIAIPVV
ncbi:MAG: hypothetical protein ACI4QT_03100 [Kiritimatiellia bacterium]